MAHNLKSIKADFKARGVFYTPPELVALLREYAPENPKNVYDPTCGDGALLSSFSDNISKYGQEIDPNQLEVAKSNVINFTGYAGDTLADPAFMDKKFDLIMANPPFSVKWEQRPDDIRFKDAPALAPKSKADYAFILHILHLLDENGTAIILNFPGIGYRGNAEGKIRQWLIDMNVIDKVVHIPGDTFVDTKIATLLLVLKKNKTSTDIVFEDRENRLTRTVGIGEIKDNSFSLSVSTYVQKEEVVIPIDPIELEMKARRIMLMKLNADIHMSQYACQVEGLDLNVFLDELQSVIDKYRT